MKPLFAGPEDAPPLVLLHGWGASKEIWKASLEMGIGITCRMIAIDLPGVGDNPDPGHSGSPQKMAESIAHQLEEMGLKRYSVLGHSLGANVAARLAATFPDRIDKLILVSCALECDPNGMARHYLHKIYGTPLLNAFRQVAGFAGWIEEMMPPCYPSSLGWTRGYMRRSGLICSRNNMNQLLKQLQGLIENPINIGSLAPETPLLMIHGGKDDTIPVKVALDAAECRPQNTTMLVYVNARHCPMDTHSHQFADDVSKFLGDNTAK